jgi:hypothetical protein
VIRQLVGESPEVTVRVSMLPTYPEVMVSRASEAQSATIKAALGQLNGTDAAAVSLITGLDTDELDDLGGLPKQDAPASGGKA